MNREQAKQAIEVMQAWVDGEPIEFRQRKTEPGSFMTPSEGWGLGWNWDDFEYRRKPVPKVVERWFVSDAQGNQLMYRSLHEARQTADNWENDGRKGIALTHLKGEEQPWQK